MGLLRGTPSTVAPLQFATPPGRAHEAINPERLHLDHERTGFAQDATGLTAQFAHQATAQGDVLTGADGLRSVIRARMFSDGPLDMPVMRFGERL